MYDKIFEPMNRGLRLLGIRMFRPEADMEVLDVGCGTGLHLELFQRFQCRLHGIDSSPSMLNIARNRLGEAADLRLGDASRMPYGGQSFDLITSMLVLHEMRHQTRITVINEMKRVLKDSGHILLIDFHPGPIRPLKGWSTKTIIFFSELAAGREHFKNYRHFMAIKGLPAIIDEVSLGIEREKIVGGGALALFLLNKTR
ncbi:MAG: methyltransferase domain-containing protein [Anaerolineales bacterium]